MSKLGTQGSDNYEFELIGTDKYPWLGYNSNHDRTTISPQFMVRGSQNMYLKTSGTWANRPGLKTLGINDLTLAGVKSSWVWNSSLGYTYPVRVANNKLQFLSSILGTPIWYDLLLSDLTNPAATLSRFVFDAWYSSTEKKDRLVFVRGDANILSWSGGVAVVASGTINTLTKTDSTKTWNQAGFNATGTEKKGIVSISGTKVEFTYTGGENTTTLTGVNLDMRNVDVGTLAIQSVFINVNGSTDMIPDTGFLNDMCRVIGNQLCVGSYTSRLVYISSTADFRYFTVPTPPIAGSPELLTLDNTLKGIAVRQGNIWCSAGTKDWYEITFSNITVGSILERQTTVSKKNTAELAAAYAHEFIDNWGDDIIYLAQDQQVRDIGTFVGVLNGQKFPSISIPVMTELSEEDFTGGHLRIIGEPRQGSIMYITAPNTGRDYMFTVLEEANDQGGVTSKRVWHPPQVRNISRFDVINGVTYGHSNANPMIYQVWDTAQWHDDSPSGENLAYVSILMTGYRSFGRRQGKWAFNKLFSMGYISQGTELLGNVYLDYQGASGISNVLISSNDSPSTQFIAQSAPSLGDSSLGDNPLGDGVNTSFDSQDLLPKFYNIRNLTAVPVYEVAIKLYSETADSRWELLCLGVNPWLSSQQPGQLQQ